jgi:ABC-type microcin C transport system permease subunit YejB
MKNWLTGLGILLGIAVVFYGLTYFAIIPQIARVLVPDKWKSLVINQKQSDYLDYLGKPIGQKEGSDRWQVRNGHYQFSLFIQYNATDSVSKKYRITYEFRDWLFERKGSLQGDSTVQNGHTKSL